MHDAPLWRVVAVSAAHAPAFGVAGLSARRGCLPEVRTPMLSSTAFTNTFGNAEWLTSPPFG
jgi:hypothetical protein